MMQPITSIALVDDHILLRNGLANLLKNFGYNVLFEADNGEDFIKKLKNNQVPDVVLLDINMPKKDGYDTAQWLKQNHPDTKILALSMYDDENSIIRMLKNGAKGYILKDTHPSELKSAIEALVTKGFYYSEMVTGKLIHTINTIDNPGNTILNMLNLNAREIEFLKLSATEMTYKEIADKMSLSPRTIDGYRDDLFEKLKVKSRIGLVIFAIKHGIASVN